MNEAAARCQRIDQWLWQARRFATRTAAARHIESAGVRVIRSGASMRISKPSFCIRPGDEIAFIYRGAPFALRVVSLGVRRGPASEASALFQPCGD